VAGPSSVWVGDAGGGRAARRLLLSLVLVALLVAYVLPMSASGLGGSAGFMPAMVGLVVGLDLISGALLIGAFGYSGDRRALVLASSYLFSLVVLAGFSASFPGIMGVVGPLGAWPSTAPWLWVIWHTGFPVLIASAVAPWPRSWTEPVIPAARRRAVTRTLATVIAVSVMADLLAVMGRGWLPVLIHGLDTSDLTKLTGPVTLPIVTTATGVAVLGAIRMTEPLRWAALACTAVLGDVVLTLFSLHRFSLGWYVGRSLTVVSSAVVLVAMLAEFSRLRGRLAVKADSLQELLRSSEELETLHSTLLNLMSDGVTLRGPDGRLMAANPAAERLLGLTADQLHGRARMPPSWTVLRTDGTQWASEDTPDMVTFKTGIAQRDRILGVPQPDGHRRWLRVNTAATRDSELGRVQYVVSSLTDETERQTMQQAATQDSELKRGRVQAVLDVGGPDIVVQPILDLHTRAVIGGEALARFAGPPVQSPDRWFADASAVGLGHQLELAAVRAALTVLAATPAPTYLSINVSPATATSDALFEVLDRGDGTGTRVVLELTEHSSVTDYPTLRSALLRLRTLGVRVAVDDAGAGFASLSHILNLRPDIVKLDIALVRGIHADPARRALATGLLIFANEIGASLVAEGIETEAELTALREVGISYGQGFYLGRPAAQPRPEAVPAPRPAEDATEPAAGNNQGPTQP
jgi:PAS domain S-box-containing protein